MSEKRSRYLEAGSPTSCRLSVCWKPFLGRCTRGNDGYYYCSQTCADHGRSILRREAGLDEHPRMSEHAARIMTICECIDHCFASAMWIEDFARHVDPEDMVMGLDRAYDVVTDATRLHSLVALRRLNEFLRTAKKYPDDLIASDLGIDATMVLGEAGKRLLSEDELTNIHKGAAHLTERLTLSFDSEHVELEGIIDRSLPFFRRLVTALTRADTNNEVARWLENTEALLTLAEKQAQEAKDAAAKTRREFEASRR